MEKHWKMFGVAVALWTIALLMLVSATIDHSVITATWSAMTGLIAACVSILLIARSERMKLEAYAHGLAKQMARWTAEQLADAEVPRVPSQRK